MLKLLCGSLPESGSFLASRPTFSWMENSATRRSCHRIAQTLFELYLTEREKGGAPKKVLLDFDSTADPAHGDHEGSYYRRHIYHPLLVFDDQTGHLICALLSAGNTHASNSSVALLERIVSRLRGRWSGVEIEKGPTRASPFRPSTTTAKRKASPTPWA
ncbi:MAG TPA: transposase [Rubrobacter sp.]|nr:transposase [Rubrobacter sp.]